MTDSEVMSEIVTLSKDFSDADFDALENALRLKAASLHWTGHPLRQPPRSVLASAREVAAKKACI